MMDNRRLDTMGVLNAGVLSKPPIKSMAPERELAEMDEELPISTFAEVLETKVIECPEYYGLFRIWKSDSGYSGELMQYRSLTDSFSDATLEEAHSKAIEWYVNCVG